MEDGSTPLAHVAAPRVSICVGRLGALAAAPASRAPTFVEATGRLRPRVRRSRRSGVRDGARVLRAQAPRGKRQSDGATLPTQLGITLLTLAPPRWVYGHERPEPELEGRARIERQRGRAMSAASPSYDRDLDALHRAQRAYEPSMEEILASIRNIIADEKPTIASPPEEYLEPEPAIRPVVAEPALAVSALSALSEGLQAPHIPRVVWQQPTVVRPSPEPSPTTLDSVPRPAPDADDIEEPLISRETDAAVSHSFETLAVGLVAQNPAMIEGIVREMIRPMLKTWLDDNLPSVVERLVRAEIQRVARGGR